MRNQSDKNGPVCYECKDNRVISIPFRQSSQFINDLTLSHDLSKEINIQDIYIGDYEEELRKVFLYFTKCFIFMSSDEIWNITGA